MKKYDYIILGTGPAAYQLIKLLAKQHKSILAIESGLFGGTCPNVGFEPKIYLDGAVQAALLSKQLEGHGRFMLRNILLRSTLLLIKIFQLLKFGLTKY